VPNYTDVLQAAVERSLRYLHGIHDRRVAPLPEQIDRLHVLAGPLPDAPTDPTAVLALLDEIGSPATMASAGGRYFGFVIGGSLPVALAANWLAGAWDQNAGLVVSSPVAAALEECALRWLVDVLSLPPGTGGGFVTGATMANFTALAAARHAVLAGIGWDVEALGLFEAPPITVMVGEEVHVSLLKALMMLGLGRDRIVRVPADGQGRMQAGALPSLTGPTIVCAQAGNVNSGAFDPMSQICTAAHAVGAWVHVDGAFGLWASAAPERSHLTQGVDEADSWALDAHKWLNVPYDSGVAFVRQPGHMRTAMGTSAAYLTETGQREPYQYTPEMSRRARGVEIWAALRALGRSGLADLVERTCRQAARFAKGLRDAGYDVLNDVVLNQVLVAFGSDETTRRVITGIQSDGTCWCGGTVWHGRAAMRISVSSWATTDEDIDRSLAAILRVARVTQAG
jgi:glutamate/tyrosine decarboxylase-like PLP-dependent enzyme